MCIASSLGNYLFHLKTVLSLFRKYILFNILQYLEPHKISEMAMSLIMILNFSNVSADYIFSFFAMLGPIVGFLEFFSCIR